MAVTLPEELVEDILERLPAKSLIRFKSVQRSWNTLFKTNTFVRRHYQRQRVLDERFIISHHDPRDLHSPLNLKTFLSSNHPTLLQFPPPQYPAPFYFTSFYHCNGVICFDYYERSVVRVALWNPATREFKHVPPSPWNQVSVPHFKSSHIAYYRGFGADRHTFLDFKLIEFQVTFPLDCNNDTLPLVFAEVYNSSTNSWTVLRDGNANDLAPVNKLSFSDFDFHFGYSGFGNGCYHWLSNDSTFILCFDFRSNLFWTLDTPTTLSGKIFGAHDSIAYAVKHSVCENREENRFEIWILKQDRSWTKFYNIGPFYTCVEICSIWKDGAEFLTGCYGQELVSYNSDGQPLCQFKFSIEGSFGIHKYVESIAPLSL